MDFQEKLQEAGLTGNESKVYLNLIKYGESSANQISKTISMDRTLTYSVLNNLIEKGQVGHIIKDKKKIFSITNPDNLLNNLKSKEIIVNDLIKELHQIKPQQNSETQIQILEGKQGIRTLISIAFKEKSFASFGSTGEIYFKLYEMPHLAKQIIKNKIDVRILGDKKYEKTIPFNVSGIKYRYLNISSKATTSIFGDYVSIHLAKDQPKTIIILIKNKEIAKSYLNHFNWMWKLAKD